MPSRKQAVDRWRILAVLFVTLMCFLVPIEARRNKKVVVEEVQEKAPDDIPNVPFLVEFLGKEIYSAVNRPKYKFYIYMTMGSLPNEEATIVCVYSICSFLYGICILIGFICLPRNIMLLGTLLTLYIGPALVLILLGAIGGILVAFCLYPTISVSAIWVFFFLTSQMAQVLGRKLGLDHDKDGDVDLLDLLHYAASKKWGKAIGLPRLHTMLNESSMDPFQEVHRRLDVIQNHTQSLRSIEKE